MVEIRLSYNPFRVRTEMSVREGDGWMTVEEESGLMKISNMRMQRWLEPMLKYSFFDDLREAAGDDEITLHFSGTAEDLVDLQDAAARFCSTHHGVRIEVLCGKGTETNSSRYKLEQLQSVVDEVTRSDFQSLLPGKTMEYLDGCLNPKGRATILMPLSDLPEQAQWIFSDGAWQMVCLTFEYGQMQSRENRALLRDFAQRLEELEDRSFERERFLFLCTVEDNEPRSKDAVRRLLMEYGIGDMCVAVLTSRDVDAMAASDRMSDKHGAREAARAIRLFTERYADQYRLRKLHDVLERTMREQGYIRGSKLLRTVDEALRGEGGKNAALSDETVRSAAEWVTRFYDSIDRLIDVDA